MCHVLLIHSSTVGHFGLFYLLTVVNHDAGNMSVQRTFWGFAMNIFGVYTQKWNSRSHSIYIFNLLRNQHSIFFWSMEVNIPFYLLYACNFKFKNYTYIIIKSDAITKGALFSCLYFKYFYNKYALQFTIKKHYFKSLLHQYVWLLFIYFNHHIKSIRQWIYRFYYENK
jgi:hypothetical protein